MYTRLCFHTGRLRGLPILAAKFEQIHPHHYPSVVCSCIWVFIFYIKLSYMSIRVQAVWADYLSGLHIVDSPGLVLPSIRVNPPSRRWSAHKNGSHIFVYLYIYMCILTDVVSGHSVSLIRPTVHVARQLEHTKRTHTWCEETGQTGARATHTRAIPTQDSDRYVHLTGLGLTLCED